MSGPGQNIFPSGCYFFVSFEGMSAGHSGLFWVLGTEHSPCSYSATELHLQLSLPTLKLRLGGKVWGESIPIVLSIDLSKDTSGHVCEGISRDDWMPRALTCITVYPLAESRFEEVMSSAGTVKVMAGRRKWLNGVP